MAINDAETSYTDEEWVAAYREELDNISDGSHTFGELYRHRAALLIALMCQRPALSWWSTLHHDGTMLPLSDDFIIAGMQLPTGPITYHLRAEPWAQVLTNSPVPFRPTAPDYDGHKSSDVEDRLVRWISGLRKPVSPHAE